MRALIKSPSDTWFRVVVVPNELHTLQELVGGYIETVTVSEDVCVICNEEGRLHGLEFNCVYQGVGFVGTILLVGVDGEEFTDCPLSVAQANGGINT